MGNSNLDVLDGLESQLNDANTAIKGASDTEMDSSRKIKWAGTFIMGIESKAWKAKDSDEITCFPCIKKASTGTVQGHVILKVLEGDEFTKEGDFFYTNFTLIMPSADEEKRKKVANIVKPRLTALANGAEVEFTKEWLGKYLTVDYTVDDKGKPTITRSSSLTGKVIVKVDVKPGNNVGEIDIDIKSIRPYVEGAYTATDKVTYDEWKALDDARKSGASAATTTSSAPTSYGAATEAGGISQPAVTKPVEDDLPF